MNLRVKLRLLGLAGGIALMGVAIVLMTLTSQHQAGELRARLSQVDSESFRIADEFRDFLRQLNGSLYRYGSEHNPADLERFLQASRDLNLWIGRQTPRLTTTREKSLMEEIDAAYNSYLRVADELQARLKTLGTRGAAMADYAGLQKQSQHLFDLGQALGRAHYESRGAVISQANQTISELRLMVLVSLSCLFVFAVVLAWVAYRDMVAPLRVKLVESQALLERQEKLASLGMLAAGVAHEIRNPLTAIKAALFIQQKRFSAGSPEAADTKVIEREILRLEKIVSDFLLFARPSEPQFATLAADAVLREVQALLAAEFAKNNIQLLLEDAPPLRFRADPAQIKQVLINLVQNAADAVGRNGVVKLRARLTRKRLGNSEGNVVLLQVTDNGKGIPAEVQQRLFDPFFTTKDSGTGLGLSIAAGIVQKHGGALEYQTQVDYGTTFGIMLPLAIA